VGNPLYKYNVHIFAVYRVKITDVEATCQTEAIAAAMKQFDPDHPKDPEFAEEVSHYLVDEQGDTEFENSCFYLDREHHVQQVSMALGGAVEVGHA
jgi:hypothetical protein